MKLKHLKKYKEAYTSFASLVVAVALIALATYAWYNVGDGTLNAGLLQIETVDTVKVAAKLYVNESETPQEAAFYFENLVPEEYVSFRLELKNDTAADRSISITFGNILDIISNSPYYLTDKLKLYDLSATRNGVASTLPNLTSGGFLSELSGTEDHFSFLSSAIIYTDETLNIYFKIKLDATAGNGYSSLSSKIGKIVIITGGV